MSKFWHGTALAVSLSFMASSALASATHPLDGMTKEEYTIVVKTLKTADKLSDDGLFPLIEIVEPSKDFVLSWKKGEKIPRTARAVIKDGGKFYDATIDLNAEKLLSHDVAAGQGMILFDEFIGAMGLALSDERMIASLAKRGLTPDDVFCLPLTAGNFGVKEDQGRRLLKAPCYMNPTGSNFYALPIEGLFSVIDLNKNEVIDVVDIEVVPLPKDGWGYTDAEIEARYGLRKKNKPTIITQPSGNNITIENSVISWDMWRFHIRTDKRPGVVLSQIEVNDQAKWRSVLYQANLSEVFVPYMDPSEAWQWRTYMDSGEYGFGLFMSPLRPKVDCPAYATYMPARIHSDRGEAIEIPDAICIFERPKMAPAWRHFEIFAQSEISQIPAEGRAATELVVRYASEVGNYDYLIDYVFNEDGKINVQVGATGLDAVKGVAAVDVKSPTAEQDTRYGTLIAPNLVAPNHDHFFNFRFDFDVDGRDNTFFETKLVAQELPKESKRRSIWKPVMTWPKTEDVAKYRVNPSDPAMYHVGNMNVESGLGHKPHYMIMSENGVAYSPLDVENDMPIKRNAYIDYTYWVTPHDPKQRYAGGEFAF
ncbi:MAG: tyramine oxidase, partial [Rhizobiales bacterium]|nr:tyramine oxidase [Hyphomicrobiales bacterium]